MAPLAARAWESVRGAVHWLADHTGVPVTVAAAAVLVVSWNVARRAGRFFVQFVVMLAVLVFATEMGWIRW